MEELKLRPSNFENYIGQTKNKNNLKIFVHAAKERNESLDHILFYGPPGLGKTTLAQIIANEMNRKIVSTNGPVIEKPSDLITILSQIEPGDILFIDEIHRIPKVIEEILYTAMEDFLIDIIIGKDDNKKSIKFDLPPFTLIGATTRPGLLSSPLRDRFGIIQKMEFYSKEELNKIIKRTASIYDFEIDDKVANVISSRSRGTPRIANNLIKRCRDFAQVLNNNVLNYEIAIDALEKMNVDKEGLTEVDIKILNTIIDKYNGGPVGLEVLANSIGEDPKNIEDINEPFLIQNEFLDRTAKGRIALKKAYKHLKKQE